MLVEKYLAKNRKLYAAFMDLEKAYDMMWRDGVLLSLSRINVNGQIFNYLRDFVRD